MNTTAQNDTNKFHQQHLENYPVVEVMRVFNAPVETVWRAWSDRELIKEWWGPEGFSAPTAKTDFREGGKYTLAMEGPDGKVIWSSGIYREIIPCKKIVSTDFFSDEFGTPVAASQLGMPGDWPLSLLVTINFTKINSEHTQVTISHQGVPAEMHDDSVEGWNSSLNRLQKLVERH